MKEMDFVVLLESVREAGSILRGDRLPARVTTIADPFTKGTADVARPTPKKRRGRSAT